MAAKAGSRRRNVRPDQRNCLPTMGMMAGQELKLSDLSEEFGWLITSLRQMLHNAGVSKRMGPVAAADKAKKDCLWEVSSQAVGRLMTHCIQTVEWFAKEVQEHGYLCAEVFFAPGKSFTIVGPVRDFVSS